MKKALFKDTVKQILKTYKRFFSILLMALLGVGFFAGIRAASPDMKKTLDKFFDEYNLYDIEVVSTLGLTDNDVEALKKVDGIKDVYPSFSTDVILDVKDEEIVVRVHQIEENVNKLKILDGYMAETNNECLVEQSFINNTGLKVGDYIEIEDKDENLVTNKLKIVGIIESPLYISRERGTSSLGSRKNFIFYLCTKTKYKFRYLYRNLYVSR